MSRARFPARCVLRDRRAVRIEDDELNFRVADHLARLAERVPGGIIFKASFDKANRSNRGAARGPGIDEGLAALARVRERTGLPVLTDVHLPEQCAAAAQVADVLQIPAFLCRQIGPARGRGRNGKAGEREEGAVDASGGHARRRRQGARRRHDARSPSPSAARSSATAISWWTCARSRACARRARRPSSSTARTACSSPVAAKAGAAAARASSFRRSRTPPLPPARMDSFSRRIPIPTHAPSDGPEHAAARRCRRA